METEQRLEQNNRLFGNSRANGGIEPMPPQHIVVNLKVHQLNMAGCTTNPKQQNNTSNADRQNPVDTLCDYVMQKWPELLMRFVISVLGVALGVSLGFVVDRCRTQKVANEVTSARLHVMFLEINHNIEFSMDVLEFASEPETYKANISDVHLDAAELAFHDDNIFEVVPPEVVILIQHYIETGKVLSSRNGKYLDYAASYGFSIPEDREHIADGFKEKLKVNAAEFAAPCDQLQQELPKYFDKSIYAKEETRKAKAELEATLEWTEQKILRGEYKRRDE